MEGLHEFLNPQLCLGIERGTIVLHLLDPHGRKAE